jgi:hypothetical protein
MNQMNACMIDGVEWFVPNGVIDSYGSVAAIGDDPKKMLDELKERIESIQGYQINISTNGLDEALEKLTE